MAQSAAAALSVFGWQELVAKPVLDPASPADASFNSALLVGKENGIDLSRFEHGNPVDPGSYKVDVYVNDKLSGRQSIRFLPVPGSYVARPCFDLGQLERLGVNTSALSVSGRPLADPTLCQSIQQWIDNASAHYDSSDQRLDLTLPQASLHHTARDYVNPALWDEGVTAGFLNYTINAYQNRNNGSQSDPIYTDSDGNSTRDWTKAAIDPVTGRPKFPVHYTRKGVETVDSSAYMSLNGGFNIGGWQFRHVSNFNWSSGRGGHWQNIASFAQYFMPSIRSRLLLGDSNTSGEFFDSVGFRGVELATDDQMLPQSLRGYAPVVHGMATSNARVEIRQNGYMIYQTTVAPGAFTINDLYPTGYNGDLQVTVTEADGSVHTFSVPYSSVAQSLRPGINRYNLVVGRVRESNLDHKPFLVQGTLQRGFNNWLTGYTGVAATQNYVSALLGAAVMTPVGAFSLDLTQANTRFAHYHASHGQSLKLGFNRMINSTGTNFSVAAYRYSTSGFYSLHDALYAHDLAARYRNPGNMQRQRSRVELSINQNLGNRWGTLYVTGSRMHYWGNNGSDTEFQAGYNNNWRSLTYSLSATRSRDIYGRGVDTFYLNFSMPLGHGSHAPQFNSSIGHSSQGYTTEQLGVTGTAGTDNNFSYGVTLDHDSRVNIDTAGSANAQYRSPYSQLSVSYGQGKDYKQISAGATGSIVMHSGGVTFSPQTGDTMALVEADDARGARVTNYSGLRIDGHGYAVVPTLLPYRWQTVELDPHGLSTDIGLDSTSAQVVAYEGAIVKVRFKTAAGRSILIRSQGPDGQPLPFGASVLDAAGHPVGLVGQASELYVRGLADSGVLTVQWGTDGAMQCHIAYRLPPQDKHKPRYYETIQAPCMAGPLAVPSVSGTEVK